MSMRLWLTVWVWGLLSYTNFCELAYLPLLFWLLHETSQYPPNIWSLSVCIICMYVCVCMYVCMYVSMYVCVCMYVCIYVCMNVCMHVCMYVCIHIIYVCVYGLMYVCICMYVTMYVCIHTYICHTGLYTYYLYYHNSWFIVITVFMKSTCTIPMRRCLVYHEPLITSTPMI